MTGSRRSGSARAAVALCLALVVAGCAAEAPGDKPAPEAVTAAAARALALIDEAYIGKQTGENGAALAKLQEACPILEREPGGHSATYASCLDDQASVLLRMGDAARARELYVRARDILRAAAGADPVLAAGVSGRLDLLDRMEALGVRCAEPAVPSPDAGSAVPYFPDVEGMQRALGALNPLISVCKEGIPEAVTIRVTITGGGVPIRAETRGVHAGTPLGSCVEEKVMAAVPGADLQRFAACFRGFTYPFMVGTHPTPGGSR